MAQNRKQNSLRFTRKQTKKNQLFMNIERQSGWDKDLDGIAYAYLCISICIYGANVCMYMFRHCV